MICVPPSTPCSPGKRFPKIKSPASAATSNGKPATRQIIFDPSLRRQRHIHGLQGDFSRPRETVPKNLPAAGKQPGGQPLKNGVHRYRPVLVNPAAGFDV